MLAFTLTASTIAIFASCNPGSGSVMTLPAPDSVKKRDLTVRGVPIFSPSSENQERPLQMADGKETIAGDPVIYDGCIETSYLAAYVYAWYDKELTNDGWKIIYSRPYDEIYKEGKITSVKNGQRLEISINRNTADIRTLITYLCTKESN